MPSAAWGIAASLTRFVVNKVGGASLSDARGCAAHWFDDVRELQPDVTFIVLGGGFFAKVRADETFEGPCEPAWHDMYQARLVELIEGMEERGR